MHWLQDTVTLFNTVTKLDSDIYLRNICNITYILPQIIVRNTVFLKYKPSTSIFGGLTLVSPEGASSLVNRFRPWKYSPRLAFGIVIVNFAAMNQHCNINTSSINQPINLDNINVHSKTGGQSVQSTACNHKQTRTYANAEEPCEHIVSWNRVKYCTNVLQIAFEKACNHWMTLKVIQGHRHCCHLIGIYNFLLVFHCKYISVLHCFRDNNTYLLKKIKTSCHLDQAHLASSL